MRVPMNRATIPGGGIEFRAPDPQGERLCRRLRRAKTVFGVGVLVDVCGCGSEMRIDSLWRNGRHG